MYILDLHEIIKRSIGNDVVGGKAYNLSLLINYGFDTPSGFVLTKEAFLLFIESSKIFYDIQKILKKVTTENIYIFSLYLKSLITSTDLPNELKELIRNKLINMKNPLVAIRSSAIGEDVFESSYAGIYDSFTGIKKSNLVAVYDYIKKCYASLYNSRAMHYRLEKGKELEDVMCVIIQEMIQPDISGVLFTSYPSNREITIEASFGLGNLLVSGEVEPDRYVVDKYSRKILTKIIGTKEKKALVTKNGIKIIEEKELKETLNLSKMEYLIDTALEIEKIFNKAQDIEWAFVNDKLYILQSRPIVNASIKSISATEFYSYSISPVIKGRILKVPVKKIPDENYILLVDEPKPQYVPYLEKAIGVIADKGGILNHFAIVCRELGIPYVVKKGAYYKFRDEETVTLNLKEEFETQSVPFRQEWIRILQYIPKPPEERLQNIHKLIVENLPKFANCEYSLIVKLTQDGIYVKEDSLQKFIKDAINNLQVVCSNIESKYKKGYDFSLAVLATVLVKPLFYKLIELIGSMNLAYILISDVKSLFLSLKGDEPFLMRFGINGKINQNLTIPKSLITKIENLKKQRRDIKRKILFSLDEKKRKKVILLTKILNLLITLYEYKDKIDRK